MQAIRVRQHGGPEVLAPATLPRPEPAPGEVLVEIEAAGVNYIDLYERSGRYPAGLPYVPGKEAAGIIVEIGEGVSGWQEGARVAYGTGARSYAEYAAVAAAELVPIPAGLEAHSAAAALLQGLTAHFLSRDVAACAPGDTVLVHAAAGGVGSLLTQMLRQQGVGVIGTVGSPVKAQVAREAGANEVLVGAQADFDARVRELTSGAGVAVVYDGVGCATFARDLDCLRPRGTLVLYGQVSGPVPPFDPLLLGRKGSLALVRPFLHDFIASAQALRERAGQVLDDLASGRLRVWIGGTYPLAEAARAHRLLESRASVGKLLLLPGS